MRTKGNRLCEKSGLYTYILARDLHMEKSIGLMSQATRKGKK